MRHGMGALLLIVAAALSVAPAFSQSAEDRESARALLNKGDAAFDKKDFAEALKAYEAADSIMHVPTTMLAVARAQAELGKLVEARDTALKVVRTKPTPNEPEAFPKARIEADELAKSLQPRIPELVIHVKGPAEGVEVTIDGSVLPSKTLGVPRKLNPGKHVIVAKAAGFQQARAELELAEKASETVSLELKPEASTAPSTGVEVSSDQPSAAGGTSPLVYVGFGMGAVGIAVGSVTGLMAMSKASSVKEQCVDNKCPPSTKDDLDSSKTLGTISTIGFGVGLAGVALGVWGLMSSGAAEKPPSNAFVEPVIGSRYLGVRGAF